MALPCYRDSYLSDRWAGSCTFLAKSELVYGWVIDKRWWPSRGDKQRLRYIQYPDSIKIPHKTWSMYLCQQFSHSCASCSQLTTAPSSKVISKISSPKAVWRITNIHNANQYSLSYSRHRAIVLTFYFFKVIRADTIMSPSTKIMTIEVFRRTLSRDFPTRVNSSSWVKRKM